MQFPLKLIRMENENNKYFKYLQVHQREKYKPNFVKFAFKPIDDETTYQLNDLTILNSTICYDYQFS